MHYCFPLRIDWENTLPPVPAEPYPVPLVSSRDSFDLASPPASFLRLEQLAIGFGWATMAQYAEGWTPHARTGRPGAAPHESWCLRLRRADHNACAVYTHATATTWKWESLWSWSPARFFARSPTLEAFQERLT